MRGFHVLLLAVATSTALWGSPGGVLENVRKVQVDPTVIEQPQKVKEAVAASLVRYELRAAFRDALFEEGDSPVKAHIILDEFSSEGTAKRLIGLGSGRSVSTVDGRLVIEDAGGTELASVKFHVHGTVASSPADGNNPHGHQPASDFERRMLEEIERLK